MTAAELEFPSERIQVMHLVVKVWKLSREVLGRASPMLNAAFNKGYKRTHED